MKAILYKLCCVVTLLTSGSIFSQTQSIEYSYDANGNRVFRQVVLIPTSPAENSSNITEVDSSQSSAEVMNSGMEVDLGSIIAFPIPTESEVHFKAAEGCELIESIQVYSMSGKELLKVTNIFTDTYTINLSSFSSGNYICTVRTGVGLERFKIVKY